MSITLSRVDGLFHTLAKREVNCLTNVLISFADNLLPRNLPYRPVYMCVLPISNQINLVFREVESMIHFSFCIEREKVEIILVEIINSRRANH